MYLTEDSLPLDQTFQLLQQVPEVLYLPTDTKWWVGDLD